jgi:hypothetical protein
MALIPPRAAVTLAAMLIAACNQSLFGDPGDDSRAPGPVDAGLIIDAGDGVVRPDANVNPPPDAAVPAGCAALCVDDAVANYRAGAWLYAEDKPSPFATAYTEMSLVDRDGAEVWVGDGVTLQDALPAIVHCPTAPGYPGCAGVTDKLLLETTEPDVTHPALVWMPPAVEPHTYRLSGDWRVPPDARTGTPMTLLLARNSRFDSALDERFSTRALPAGFDFDIDVLPGDILRLIALSGDTSHVPLALSFYVSEARNPSACQMAPDFATLGDTVGLLFPNRCGSGAFQDSSDTGDSCDNGDPQCPRTTIAPPPTGVPGRARVFVEGASMKYLGPPNGYSGDFTVQFWAHLDSGGATTSETLLADHSCAAERGIGVHRSHLDGTNTSALRFEVYYDDPTIDRCVDGPTAITAITTEDAWHFFRLTRSTYTETLSLCIDGAHVRDVDVPRAADISATEPMWLGRNVNQAPARFRGRLADVRVLETALPCAGL